MSYRGLGDPTLFSGLTPSLIFRLPPTTCNSPCLPRIPYTLVVPTAAFPAFYGTPTPSIPSPTADTAHCPECCVVASSGVLLALLPLALSARPPRSILYNYPAYITKVAAKLFPPPRETAPFNPLLANSEPVRLTLFLSSRAPLARMRFIGLVFRPCRFNINMSAFPEYSVFASFWYHIVHFY